MVIKRFTKTVSLRSNTILIRQVNEISLPLNDASDLRPLIEKIGDARYVLLGEASHGTSEYYQWRTRISKQLIREKGFSFIAVEGDWPDCYQVNRYVKGLLNDGTSARTALESFVRWPTWMWANDEIVELAEWLRKYNTAMIPESRVGFFGLDVYSLWESLYSVLDYLRKEEPSLMPAARRAFRCFEPYSEDPQHYARSTAMVPISCENEVINLLNQLCGAKLSHPNKEQEEYFTAEQNALVVKNAEAYYRAMVRGGPSSWNIRDRHMTETLERLVQHHGKDARAIIWEHNTHIGDARATDMADEGMVNVGQLVRENHGNEGVFTVGFGSHHGSVIAGKDWDAPMEKMEVPPARDNSWEDILHRSNGTDKLLLLDNVRDSETFIAKRGHRAIGVVYHPEYEHLGNYVPTVLPKRYDAFCYFDETEALHPLHLRPALEKVPETYPWGV